jgi:hypothetical protein
MRIHERTALRLLAITAIAAPCFVACSGIDGLPEQPVQASDSGASVSDAATAAETGPIVDAGGADAGVDASEEGDASVVDAADATTTADASADATVDAAIAVEASVDSGPCFPETDAQLCAARGKNCGRVDTVDRCGSPRIVSSCGVCTGFYETCGAGGVSNVCGCPSESDWAFCWRLGRTCGQVTASDSCGLQRSATCGSDCPLDAGADSSTPDAGPVDAGVPDASVVQRWTFTNCGASGATGPTQAQCNAEYNGTSLAGRVGVSAGIQEWSVPEAGNYRIAAMGAEGGDWSLNTQSLPGGRGAYIQGEFTFSENQRLRVLVGQRGSSCENEFTSCGGGGGGSFVSNETGEPVVVAGGGGGTCWNASQFPGCPCDNSGIGGAQSALPGCGYLDGASRCVATYFGWYGSCGAGSISVSQWVDWTRAGSGGGFSDGPSCPADVSDRLSGLPFARGGTGAAPTACRAGGFGGGGAGGGSVGDTAFGGGGGGGFSGGSMGAWREAANNGSTHRRPGSGGSSFSAGTNPANFSGYRRGHGIVTIERLR